MEAKGSTKLWRHDKSHVFPTHILHQSSYYYYDLPCLRLLTPRKEGRDSLSQTSSFPNSTFVHTLHIISLAFEAKQSIQNTKISDHCWHVFIHVVIKAPPTSCFQGIERITCTYHPLVMHATFKNFTLYRLVHNIHQHHDSLLA